MILYVAWSNILVSSVCHSSVASTRAKPTGFLARLAAIFHPISTFDVGWQPEILSPIARLPAGLYYSIRSAQNMRALSGDWF